MKVNYKIPFVYFLLLAIVTKAYPQGGGTGTQSPIALEKVTPPSPEAGALSRYGNFPVGLFTGTPNVSIELFQLKSKHLELPVSIGYSSNGLRVDEMPTKLGMTWTLHAGGAITRTIYDKPDGTTTWAGTPYTDAQISSNNSTDLSVPAWLEQIDAQHLDTQYDEYNFNFSGYSGKFIIDANNNPVLIPYANLKIQLNPFRITTPEGIQYEFTATENSYIGSGGCSRDNGHPAPSAWYLTKVTDLNNPSDFITLTYVTGGYNYHPNINQTITFFDNSNTCTGNWSGIGADGGDPCGCGPTPCIYGGKGSISLGVDNFCTNTENLTVQYIDQITSSTYGKIKFNYNTSYPTSATPIENDRLLTSIQVFQNNDGTGLLKSFNLSYAFAKPSTSGKITSLDGIATQDPDVSSYRPFLSTLQELDKSGVIIKTHSFEYNDIDHLTARLSSSQDYWGYYNGKSNPHSLIPTDGGTSPNSLLVKDKIADRNPDYNYAVKGMLTKVNFPTGGYTQFSYEGNTSRTSSSPAIPPSPHYAVISGSVSATNVSHSATFYVLTPVTVTVDRYFYCSNCSGGVINCTTAAGTQVMGQINYTPQGGTTTTLKNYTFAEYNQRGECSFSRSETLTLDPGVYGLSVPGFSNYQLSITVQATNGTLYTQDAMTPNTVALSTDGGGLRVKQQIIYDPFSQKTTTTNYEYSGMIIPYTPMFANNVYYKHSRYESYDDGMGVKCSLGAVPCAIINSCNYLQYSSNSSINTSGRGSSPVYYTSVTESIGDNYIVGGTEHTYMWSGDADLNLLKGKFISGTSAPSYAWKNGLETNQNIFKMVNGTKVYLKKVTNFYKDDSRINNSYQQYIIKKSGICETLSSSTNCPTNLVFSQRMDVFDVISYSTPQLWTYLYSSREINYDMDGNNPVTTTTNYFYDNPVHAKLTRVETTNSKGAAVKSIKKYPGDAATITNLTTSETDAITKLQAMNNFSPLLESEQYVNSNLQTRIHTGYKDWGNGIINPETIKAQTLSNSIESRIQFLYDNTGTLEEQQKTNDSKEVYLWGYKSQYPVAKIIGTDYTTAVALVTQSILNAPSGDQALRTELNKLRTGLPNALVTTYTYSPLIGITSETDPGGRTTYYNYDNFNRLQYIRDQNGNIVKQFDYKYQVSPTN